MSASSSTPPSRKALDTGSDIANVFLSHANCVAEFWSSNQTQSAPLKHGAGVTVPTKALAQPVVSNAGSFFHGPAGRAFVASHEVSVLMVTGSAVAVAAAPTASATASNIPLPH